jgi:hypothetical protein
MSYCVMHVWIVSYYVMHVWMTLCWELCISLVGISTLRFQISDLEVEISNSRYQISDFGFYM